MGKTVIQIIAEHRGGVVARELNDDMEKLIAAAQESGKKGELNIKIKVRPVGKQNREIHLRVMHQLRAPASSSQDEESIWFGVRGQLQREDPDNGELFGPKGVELEIADGRSPAEQPRRSAGQ